MRVLVQRVKKAKVTADYNTIAEIKKGFLLFVGIGKEDEDGDIKYLARKILQLRIFEDKQQKMNLNIQQISGEILSVSQFTLYADTTKGNRPGFDDSAEPSLAEELWMKFNRLLTNGGVPVKQGIFAANMEVELINDGPVTVWLDSER